MLQHLLVIGREFKAGWEIDGKLTSLLGYIEKVERALASPLRSSCVHRALHCAPTRPVSPGTQISTRVVVLYLYLLYWYIIPASVLNG